ncbi:hypothetical protein, partial [Clostridium tarantellae]|uniref:hypothetical protein n=1 Tax=Clostridium tarantellae TaxID=39493 RepID=UPI001A9A8312
KLYTRDCLLLLELNNLSISPQGKGIGSKIFNKIVEEVSSIETIEKIILYPKDKYAKNFWVKNGFKEITIEDIDYRVNYGFKNLIYYIKHF